MSVAPIQWRTPGCGVDCRPGRHDPVAHEAAGFRLALLVCAPVALPKVVKTGPLVVDLAAERVTVDGVEVQPATLEWRVLAHLAEWAGQVCAYDEMLVAIWGEGYLNPRDRYVSLNRAYRRDYHLVRQCLVRLRKRLGAAGRLIVTVPKVGLRLEVEP